MTMFAGERGVETFRAISLKIYKRGQYDLVVTDLETWIKSNGATGT